MVELISGQRPRADHIYTKMTEELNGLSISQLNPSKIQEVLDKVTLNKLNKTKHPIGKWLGARLFEKERNCPYCKTGSLDTLGDQAVTRHGWGDIISRHNWLRDNTLSAFSAANLSPVCEQQNLIPETSSRSGDLFLLWWSAGQP